MADKIVRSHHWNLGEESGGKQAKGLFGGWENLHLHNENIGVSIMHGHSPSLYVSDSNKNWGYHLGKHGNREGEP